MSLSLPWTLKELLRLAVCVHCPLRQVVDRGVNAGGPIGFRLCRPTVKGNHAVGINCWAALVCGTEANIKDNASRGISECGFGGVMATTQGGSLVAPAKSAVGP